MLIVGLTGSIGMGKSTAGARFRERGYAVFDADAEVHALYAGPMAAEIDTAFPGTVVDGRVDRGKLSAALIAAPHRFKDLEHIVHPRVRAEQRTFLEREAARGARISVLEIPLLFESLTADLVDVTVVVSSSPAIQRARVMGRPGMTGEKLDELLRRQLPDAEKRRRADFVVDTNGSVDACNTQVDAIIEAIQQKPANAYGRFWT